MNRYVVEHHSVPFGPAWSVRQSWDWKPPTDEELTDGVTAYCYTEGDARHVARLLNHEEVAERLSEGDASTAS